jgi:hypothetical protein
VLEPDHAPYGQQLVMVNPAIPTLPTEPDASLQRFSLTVGSARHGRHGGGGAGLISVPRTCPAGGFPFGASFSYADGSMSATTATVPCP